MCLMMSICPKCGSFKVKVLCDYCNVKRIETETTLGEVMDLSEKQEEALIDHYIETLIKDTYDPKVRAEREAYEKRKAYEKPAFSGYVPKYVPTCPTCGSTSVGRISIGKKIFGGAMFGLFSSDVRNTMHCRNCGAKW